MWGPGGKPLFGISIRSEMFIVSIFVLLSVLFVFVSFFICFSPPLSVNSGTVAGDDY